LLLLKLKRPSKKLPPRLKMRRSLKRKLPEPRKNKKSRKLEKLLKPPLKLPRKNRKSRKLEKLLKLPS